MRIALTKGKFAIVDDSDFHILNAFHWFYHAPGYAGRQTPRTCGKQREIKMHRYILGITSPMVDVDHINGNGLDNRRCNLRICNPAQNRINSRLNTNNKTGFRGVSRHAQTGRFMAYIGHGGKTRYLGIFKTAQEAANARKSAERDIYKEFARS